MVKEWLKNFFFKHILLESRAGDHRKVDNNIVYIDRNKNCNIIKIYLDKRVDHNMAFVLYQILDMVVYNDHQMSLPDTVASSIFGQHHK